MGRGRAKAKQAKVARKLKYSSPEMDIERLQRELAGSQDNDHSGEDDEWNDWDDAGWSPSN